MIRAVIFDCFGVLATEGWIGFKQQHFGENPAKMRRATELSHLLDAGLVSYEDAVEEIAEMAGVAVKDLDRTLKDVVANEALLEFIARALKPKYKIGLLSNVGDSWLYSLFNKDQLALFDAKSLSHEVGITKPDPRAYEIIAAKLVVEPKECLFVDDLERNVAGAQAVGMQAICYQDFALFKQQLGALLTDSED